MLLAGFHRGNAPLPSLTMNRNVAEGRLHELLERVHAGGDFVDQIDEIFVFGSYARGAATVNDIDVAVEYTPSEALHKQRMRDFWAHRSPYVDFRSELRGNRRCFEIQFNEAEKLRAEGFELQSIFRRGDTLEDALTKLQALRRNPAQYLLSLATACSQRSQGWRN